MIYDAGVSSINRQWSSLLNLQQQVATGRRILTPSDDPVAASRALEITQSSDVLKQFATNQDNAKSALGLAEAQLSSANDMFARLKELTVQAGNATLNASDRRSIAYEMRERFDELMGIANSADGQGLYLFAGYQGQNKPFAGSVDQLNTAVANEISYDGDDGQRRLQVSATRMLEVSDSGTDVFMRIKNGNGHFVTNYSPGNDGTAIIDAGNVTDPAAWNSVADKNLEIRFYVDSTSTPPITYYDLVRTAGTVVPGDDVSLLTNAPPAVPAFPGVPVGLRVYEENQRIEFDGLSVVPNDYGVDVTISGSPADGDSFSLSPSSSQSIFKTLANLIDVLENGYTGQAGNPAKYMNDIGFALTNFDQANDNILRVRSLIGSRMQEVESLSSINGDLQLQYQQTLSNLQDLDYAKAISDLTRKQTDLQAAQQSFSRITQLSLFNYL
jgi:flagellar hook-associated protein 3 FlgL